MASLMRSSARNAACPSFMWYPVMFFFRAFSALTPPIPSTHLPAVSAYSVSPPVQLVGNRPVLDAVPIDVRVQEVDHDLAHHDLPHLGVHDAARHFDRHHERRTVLAVEKPGRHVVKIYLREALLLPPVQVQVLVEVAEPVEQADAGKGEGRARLADFR